MKRYNYMVLAAVAVLLAGCSKDNEPVATDYTDTPIIVNTGVNELETRAGHDNDNLPEEFVLYLDQSGTGYDYNSVVVKRENGVWNPAKKMLWQSSNPQATVVAFTSNSELNYSIDNWEKYIGRTNWDQTSAAKLTEWDLLHYEKMNVSPSGTNGDLYIQFEHVMSKLVINYSFGTELGANPVVNTCTIGNLPNTGSGNLYTAQYSSYRDHDGKISAFVDATNNRVECILFPYNNNTSKKLTLKITFNVTADGAATAKDYSCQIDSPLSGFTSGYRYTTNIRIGQDKVEPGEFIATPWEDDGTHNIVTQ